MCKSVAEVIPIVKGTSFENYLTPPKYISETKPGDFLNIASCQLSYVFWRSEIGSAADDFLGVWLERFFTHWVQVELQTKFLTISLEIVVSFSAEESRFEVFLLGIGPILKPATK